MPIIINQNLDASKLEWLEEIWEIMAYNLRIPRKQADIIYNEIIERYSEPHRSYHNLSHIYSMLMMSEDLYDFMEHHLIFELAIWFHDLIYEPSRNDNEEKSAARAEELMSPFLQENQIATLKLMIQSTAKHSPIIAHHDNKLFLDIDLAILGSTPEIYQQYAHAIRKEFNIFPDNIYNLGRKQVLEKFIASKNIYFTYLFRENNEDLARENIDDELISLTT